MTYQMYPCVGKEMGKDKCGTVQSKPLGCACLRQDGKIHATVLVGEKVQWAIELVGQKDREEERRVIIPQDA